MSAAPMSLSAVRSVMVLAPAEAMRPPAPRRYHHGVLERLAWVRRIPPRGQMVLRRLTDRPARTLLTIGGIALAAPIIVMSLFWQNALDEMISVQFSAVDRSDVTVSFTNASSNSYWIVCPKVASKGGKVAMFRTWALTQAADDVRHLT